MPTTNPPATTGSKSVAGLKGKQKRFITILQDDFNFDVIESIVKHIRQIEKAKKIKPLEKARMLQHYYLTLLSFCIPKMKLTEEGNKDKGNFIFNFAVGAQPAQGVQVAGSPQGLNVSIPTVHDGNGNYSVDPTVPLLPEKPSKKKKE